MNNMRAILNCLYHHPWQTLDELSTKTKLSKIVISRTIKKDLNLNTETQVVNRKRVTRYALYPVKSSD
jgi:hypothetical protein